MLDGDWGSKSDIVMAGAAVVAFVLSVISLLWNWLQSQHQRDWEEQQRIKQNDWHEEQNRLQTEREAQWREEDKRQMAEWRREDLERLESEMRPRINVEAKISSPRMDPRTGLANQHVEIIGVNVGQVDLRLTNWGTFYLPDDSKLSWSKSTEKAYHNTSPQDLDSPIGLGGVGVYWLSVREIEQALEENDLPRNIELRGFFTDQLGIVHLSEPFSIP